MGSSLDVRNEKVWTWNLAGIAHASHTWSGAMMNYTYMRYYSGVFTLESNPYHVGEGGGLSTPTSATALMGLTTPWWW